MYFGWGWGVNLAQYCSSTTMVSSALQETDGTTSQTCNSVYDERVHLPRVCLPGDNELLGEAGLLGHQPVQLFYLWSCGETFS